MGTVYLATIDQNRGLVFHSGVLGFEVRTDTEFGERFRWVEVWLQWCVHAVRAAFVSGRPWTLRGSTEQKIGGP